MAAPAPSANPWDEFDGPRDYKNPPKLMNVLSEGDMRAQEKFRNSLTSDQKTALAYYKLNGYQEIQYWMARGDVPIENDAASKNLRVFIQLIKGAPILNTEINVFRGIKAEERLQKMKGNVALSTSYDKFIASEFTNGRNQCCMLKINVKPGVRIFAFDADDEEHEIMILPPYNASVEDIATAPGLKRVTITPKEAPSGGRRRKTKKGKRRSGKTRRRHK
jgi:hypothetical protein